MCMAVGDYYSSNDGSSSDGFLALRWNGKTWTREQAPVTGQAGLTRVAVSCPTARRCVAVTAFDAMVWNGAKWTIQSGLTGSAVSCPSSGFCVAVGSPGDNDDPIAELLQDGTWTSEDMPRPSAPTSVQNVTLSGVSCASEHFCMAVGSYVYGTGALPSASRRVLTLAEVWNGQDWQIMPPVDPTTLASLEAVSCPSPRFCVAVGTQHTQFTLVEQWTGRNWHVQASPNLSSVGYSTLDSVACPSTHLCEAMGTYTGGRYVGTLITESQRSGRWSLEHIPSTHSILGRPTLSCPAVDKCVAVGTTGTRPYSATWNGRTWIARKTPNPLQ